MLSLSRKSDDLPEAEPLWHPNFRNTERLPDTKVVRTTFFVNAASIGALLLLSIWWGYRQYHIRSLDQQINDAQQQIDTNGKQNKEAIRLSQVFAGEEKKLTDVENFVKTPLSISDFISILAQTLPREISIEALDIRLSEGRNRIYTLRGFVAGTRDQGSGSTSRYVETLKSQPKLKEVFDPITLERLNPEGSNGLLSFEITLKVKLEGQK